MVYHPRSNRGAVVGSRRSIVAAQRQISGNVLDESLPDVPPFNTRLPRLACGLSAIRVHDLEELELQDIDGQGSHRADVFHRGGDPHCEDELLVRLAVA